MLRNTNWKKTVAQSAFLNKDGGTVVFGIRPEGSYAFLESPIVLDKFVKSDGFVVVHLDRGI
jgi:hypothetical protein